MRVLDETSANFVEWIDPIGRNFTTVGEGEDANEDKIISTFVSGMLLC